MIDQAFQSTKIIHQKIENEKRSLVPCHNDLNYRNIFFTEKNIIFIDWEMAGINYDFYDLAFISICEPRTLTMANSAATKKPLSKTRNTVAIK